MKSRSDFSTEREYNEYLRTYTAIAAMQGFLANSYQAQDLDERRDLAWQRQMEISVEASVMIADALIEQLNKQ